MSLGHNTQVVGKGESTKVDAESSVSSIRIAPTVIVTDLWVVAPANSAAKEDMFLIPVVSEMLPGMAKNSSYAAGLVTGSA